MEERFTFTSAAGCETEGRLWLPQGEIRGTVQLVHGMAEHIDRYRETAEKLNEAGYAVIGHNHAGHGPMAKIPGWFAEKGGWDALIEDIHAVRGMAEKRFPRKPHFLLGHSMGSFAVRTYCLKYEAGLTGVILSGTGHYDRATLTAGKAIARAECLAGHGKKPCKLLERISNKGINSRFEEVRSPFEWLSRDRATVEKYDADPLCGFTFTTSAYHDMFDGLNRLYPDRLDGMEKDVPVLMISGGMDPIGAYGSGVQAVTREIRAAGVRSVEVKLYPGARHEVFNELNREEVWHDVIRWMDEIIE